MCYLTVNFNNDFKIYIILNASFKRWKKLKNIILLFGFLQYCVSLLDLALLRYFIVLLLGNRISILLWLRNLKVSKD